MGSMYAAVLMLGIQNATGIHPVVVMERIVFYKERAAGMYSALPYTFAQVTNPYQWCTLCDTSIVFASSTVTLCMIAGCHWTPVHIHSNCDLWHFGVYNDRIRMDSNQIFLVPFLYVCHTLVLHILWNDGCGACTWWQYSSNCLLRFLWLMEPFLLVSYTCTCELLYIPATDHFN